MFRIQDYTQLYEICWNKRGLEFISGEEAYGLYEKLSYLIDVDAMDEKERLFYEELKTKYGSSHPQTK